MILTNPFAQLNAQYPEVFTSSLMQSFVVLMILLVIGGTVYDIMHKKSAKYFFEHAENAKKHAKTEVSSAERKGLLIKTVTNEVLTSSEFCNPKRRLSHLLTMYGFIVFIVATAILIFAYPTVADGSGSFWAFLWHLGALSLCVGGYWFWFGIRVDLTAEAKPWHEISWRADMFILSLLAMCTFGLLWSAFNSMFFFTLFVVATVVLFGGVIWSKFAHMFFKPAAAYQKKIVWADGSREGLPDMPDLSSAEVHEKFPDIPMYMGKNPPNMGLGIKAEEPKHY